MSDPQIPLNLTVREAETLLAVLEARDRHFPIHDTDPLRGIWRKVDNALLAHEEGSRP